MAERAAPLTKREAFVKVQMDIAEDFPDGAFWGFMQEHGIEPDEVVAVSAKSAPTQGGETHG